MWAGEGLEGNGLGLLMKKSVEDAMRATGESGERVSRNGCAESFRNDNTLSGDVQDAVPRGQRSLRKDGLVGMKQSLRGTEERKTRSEK